MKLWRAVCFVLLLPLAVWAGEQRSFAVVPQLDGRESAFPSPDSSGASPSLRALLAEGFHVAIEPRNVVSSEAQP